MKLTSITVGNFKNVGETTLELDKLIAIVAPNNYGKSNLMEAISFGFRFLAASPKERASMMRSTADIPLTPALSEKDYRFMIEMEDEDTDDCYRYVRYGFAFSWLKDDSGARITDETLQMRGSEGAKYTSYINRENALFRPTKDSKSFRNVKLTGETLAVDSLSAMDDIGIAGAVSHIKNLACRMCRDTDLDGLFALDPIERDNPSDDIFPLNDRNLPGALTVLKDRYPERYSLFLEAMYDLFPEFEKIVIQKYALGGEQSDNLEQIHGIKNGDAETSVPFHIKSELYDMAIASKYVNQPLSARRMSNGTKRLIWIIANAVFGDCYGINLIGVEEIETSIHPRMMKTLLESVVECLEDTRMIVTSHSPYIIRYLKPRHIYIGVPNEEGVAVFKKIRESKEKLLVRNARNLGLSVSEYIFDLMSGGERSAKVLTVYLEDGDIVKSSSGRECVSESRAEAV